MYIMAWAVGASADYISFIFSTTPLSMASTNQNVQLLNSLNNDHWQLKWDFEALETLVKANKKCNKILYMQVDFLKAWNKTLEEHVWVLEDLMGIEEVGVEQAGNTADQVLVNSRASGILGANQAAVDTTSGVDGATGVSSTEEEKRKALECSQQAVDSTVMKVCA